MNKNLLVKFVELARDVCSHVTRDLIAGQEMRAIQYQQNLTKLLDALQKRLIAVEGDGVADFALEVGLKAVAGRVNEIDQLPFVAASEPRPLAERALPWITIQNPIGLENTSTADGILHSITSNALRTADIGEKIAAIMRAAKTGQR